MKKPLIAIKTKNTAEKLQALHILSMYYEVPIGSYSLEKTINGVADSLFVAYGRHRLISGFEIGGLAPNTILVDLEEVSTYRKFLEWVENADKRQKIKELEGELNKYNAKLDEIDRKIQKLQGEYDDISIKRNKIWDQLYDLKVDNSLQTI